MEGIRSWATGSPRVGAKDARTSGSTGSGSVVVVVTPGNWTGPLEPRPRSGRGSVVVVVGRAVPELSSWAAKSDSSWSWARECWSPVPHSW